MSSGIADRKVTSAVPNMTVAEVRKCLSSMRKEWTDHSCLHPFSISTDLANNLTVGEFSFQFVLGHHSKRRK